MRSLGFVIKKGTLWFSVLDGENRNDVRIIDSKKYAFQADQETTNLMSYFHNQFSEIIEKYAPNIISYKLSLDSRLDQIPYMHFPFGVLEYLCDTKSINVQCRSNSWIVAGKKKKIQDVSNRFPNDNLRDDKLISVVVAFFNFEV